MTTNEVNTVLKQNEKTIRNAINKVNLNNYALGLRCVNKDDIYQEVCICLWKSLEHVYDETKMDVTSFISYQASLHAKQIYNNVLKSSRCFTGSKKMHKNSRTQQTKIDCNKTSYREVNVPDYSNDIECNYKKYNYLFLKGFDINSGLEIDYEYLIEEIKNRLSEKYEKKIYLTIFDELLSPSFHVMEHVDEKKIYIEGKFYQQLQKKYKFKHIENLRYVINMIKRVVIDVIKDYHT